MKPLSKMDKLVLEAFELGYRVVDGAIINPEGNELTSGLRNGYLTFTFYSREQKKRKTIMLHRLCGYQLFKDQIFDKSLEIRHLNGNRSDCSVANILLGTHQQNMMDIPLQKRLKSSVYASTRLRKFSDIMMEEIRSKHRNGSSYRELMEEYSIDSKGTMSHIINNDYITVV